MYNKVLTKYRERKILQRIFVATFGISTICIMIACSIGFSWFQKNTEKEIMESQKSELSNSFLVFNNYMTSAQDTLEILSKNTYVKRIVAMGGTSWDDNMSIVANTIVNTLSVNPRLHSIYMIGESDIIVKSTNSKYPMTSHQDLEMVEYFRGAYSKRYNMISYQDVFKKDQLMLSISTGDIRDNTLRYYQGVMVNIDMGNIIKEVLPEVDHEEDYVIMDYNFTILGTKGNRYQVGDRGLEDIYLQQVAADGKKENIFEYQVDKSSYYINYISLPGEYHLVHIMPKDNFLMTIGQTKMIVIGVGVLLTLIALIISFFVAVRVYNPIDEVVNILGGKLDSLEEKAQKKPIQRNPSTNELFMISQAMNSMVHQLNQFHEEKEKVELIHYLTSKSYQSILPEHIEESYMGRGTSNGYYVIALRICDLDDFVQNNTEEAMRFQMKSIASMADQAMNDCGEVDVVVIDNEYIAMILFNEKPSVNLNTVKRNVEEYLYLVDEMLALKLDAGISMKQIALNELHEAYQGARATTSYRFLYGMNVVIFEEQMQRNALNGGLNYDLKKLIEMVKGGNQGGFIKEYQKMLHTLKDYSIQSAHELLISLAVEMVKYHKEIPQYMVNLNISDIEQIRQEIMSFTYIGDTTTWFLDLFANILSSISKVQNSGSENIVSGTVRYIEENYMDYNLSAQFLAGKYNITPSYFSRIFNEGLGCAFPDYLNSIRLEQAKRKMIQEPDRSIQSICEENGFTSSSYFTALFKKKYGITPSKYRISKIEH